VGAYGIGCGRSDVGVSSLVALIYAKYQSEQSWGGGPPNPCAGLVDGYYCGGRARWRQGHALRVQGRPGGVEREVRRWL
jgi:hypothetical protein